MNAFKLSFVRQLFLGLLIAASFLVSGAGQAQTRPFKATISIVESVSPPSNQPPCGPALKADITGSGTAMHAGSVTGVSTDCIIPIEIRPTGAEFIATSNGLTLTAANGDKIFISYTASFSVTFTGAPGPEGFHGPGGSHCAADCTGAEYRGNCGAVVYCTHDGESPSAQHPQEIGARRSAAPVARLFGSPGADSRNIARLLYGASCEGFAVNAQFTTS